MSGLSFGLVKNLIVPAFVVDPRGVVLCWNTACESLTGVAAAELLGTTRVWTAFYDYPRPCLAELLARGREADLPLFYPEWDETGRTAVGLSLEMRCRLPRGPDRLVHLIVDAGLVHDHDGGVVGAIETMRDVTEQREAHDALRRLATLDGLTGLANRHRFDELLETELARCAREKRALSLLMIDVDCFKAFNDTYGHVAGDRCLRAVAHAIAGQLRRAGDLAARFGGEEFAVVLPETTPAQAQRIADRMVEAIAALDIPHGSSAAGGQVTISVGLASRRAGDIRAADLLGAADDALYVAKRGGRNRIAARPFALAS